MSQTSFNNYSKNKKILLNGRQNNLLPSVMESQTSRNKNIESFTQNKESIN